MSQQQNLQQIVEPGKRPVRHGAAVARAVAGKGSAEASRQAEIAKPSVRIHPQLAKASLACAAGLIGVTVLAGLWSLQTANRVDPRSIVQADDSPNPSDVETTPQPIVEKPGAVETPSRDDVNRSAEVLQQQTQRAEKSQRELELTHLRQQAQLALEQAAAEYEFALQQWNAEVAACQSGPAPGYTANQMGRLYAAGYRPQPQRQPNQALYQTARQAEQRYLQARDNCQRLPPAN